jgi:hypothetical protein
LDPVTLVRSPIMMKFDSGVTSSRSRPDRRRVGRAAGFGWRGGSPSTARAMAAMCSGVVPQQPPTMFRNPLAANSRTSEEVVSGVSS